MLGALWLSALMPEPAWAESWQAWISFPNLKSGPLAGFSSYKSFATREACLAAVTEEATRYTTRHTQTAREMQKIDPDTVVRRWTITRTGNRVTATGTAPKGAGTTNPQLITHWECAPDGVTPR